MTGRRFTSRGLILWSLLLALPARSGGEGHFENPILPGDWSDPGIVRVGDSYYTCRSSFGWQPGIPIAQSEDLVHWRYIGHAFDAFDGIRPGDTRMGIWGLELGHNPNTNEFVIYAPTREGDLYVFHSSKPAGPYEKSLLGHDMGIDPGFFADDDGRLYLITNQAVLHELGRDGLSIERTVARVDRRKYRYFEGPAVFRRGEWYYMLFSDGGTLPREPSTISVLRAERLEGPWEEDPGNPVMFSTDNGARFEGPAHGTLLKTQNGEWFVVYHAHETSHYSLGRQMLMEPIEWTSDGWWRPAGGKVPSVRARAPRLPAAPHALQQSDEFDGAELGLQWFFSCPPDRSGRAWSLGEKPGVLRIHAPAGDLGSVEALPAVFQQRVIDKAFNVETKLTIHDAAEGAAAGLHLYHDPLMNLWLAAAAVDGRMCVQVGKTTLGRRTILWSEPAATGEAVHLRIAVNAEETATFYHGGDGQTWTQLGGSVYFGASGHHLRNGVRGDPDLGWVGRYKDPSASRGDMGMNDPRFPNRGGNIWTGTTFGVFAARGAAPAGMFADFDYIRVEAP